MPTVTTDLTSEEVQTIWSRFVNSGLRLKRSGDYPEEERDRTIEGKILDLKYNLEKEERR